MYEVTEDRPARGSRDSMPLGNGEVGLNVWVEADGDLRAYLARTDAWSENARLLKLGRLRVSLDPAPATDAFEARLDPTEGAVRVRLGPEGERVRYAVRVRPDAPLVDVTVEADEPVAATARVERWRTERREIPTDPDASREIHSATGLEGAPDPVVVTPDRVVPAGDRLVWYHRNESSVWARNLRLQGLGDRVEREADPLLGRTFGGVVAGDGFERSGEGSEREDEGGEQDPPLVAPPRRGHRLTALLHTDRTATADGWVSDATARSAAVRADDADAAGAASEWWRERFEDHYVRVSGGEGAATVTRGYALQRFQTLAAGRGAYPIKFNGSLFTADWPVEGESFDPDYRRWGGHYWFQNTRLSYWPMLVAGDLDCTDPLFRLYREALPLARERTRRYFDHGGAFFPETMTAWGTYLENNYGWDREGRDPGEVENAFIRRYYQGGLELVFLALDRYAFAPDPGFLGETLLPLADAVLAFYDEHYPREDGRLRLAPAQSLETYHEAVDPLPDLAGLRAVTERLLALPAVGGDRRDRWGRLRDALPPLPTREAADGTTLLAPAAEYGEPDNLENPELYAVFPYRRFGVGRSGLDRARATYRARRFESNEGWAQDPIQAAMLGLTDEARRLVVERFGDSYEGSRFPGFWGPNYDWIPDQDHGCVGMLALQAMLLQYDDERIHLLPAWPEDWDVEFRLHAPRRTTVEGTYRDGDLEYTVTPAARAGDVVVG